MYIIYTLERKIPDVGWSIPRVTRDYWELNTESMGLSSTAVAMPYRTRYNTVWYERGKTFLNFECERYAILVCDGDSISINGTPWELKCIPDYETLIITLRDNLRDIDLCKLDLHSVVIDQVVRTGTKYSPHLVTEYPAEYQIYNQKLICVWRHEKVIIGRWDVSYKSKNRAIEITSIYMFWNLQGEILGVCSDAPGFVTDFNSYRANWIKLKFFWYH